MANEVNDKNKNESEQGNKTDFEIWQSMHGELKMPKGLFEKIYDEAKEEEDDI